MCVLIARPGIYQGFATLNLCSIENAWEWLGDVLGVKQKNPGLNVQQLIQLVVVDSLTRRVLDAHLHLKHNATAMGTLGFLLKSINQTSLCHALAAKWTVFPSHQSGGSHTTQHAPLCLCPRLCSGTCPAWRVPPRRSCGWRWPSSTRSDSQRRPRRPPGPSTAPPCAWRTCAHSENNSQVMDKIHTFERTHYATSARNTQHEIHFFVSSVKWILCEQFDLVGEGAVSGWNADDGNVVESTGKWHSHRRQVRVRRVTRDHNRHLESKTTFRTHKR